MTKCFVGSVITVTAAFLGACTQIPATNPFDPETPVEQQAEGRIVGHLYMQVPGDLGDAESFSIWVRDTRRGFLLNAEGRPKVHLTRMNDGTLVEGLDATLGVLGSFEVSVPAGMYVLHFNAEANDKPQLLDADSGLVVVNPGATVLQELLVMPAATADGFECFDTTDCAVGSRCVEGECLVDPDADRNRDGQTDGKPLAPRSFPCCSSVFSNVY